MAAESLKAKSIQKDLADQIDALRAECKEEKSRFAALYESTKKEMSALSQNVNHLTSQLETTKKQVSEKEEALTNLENALKTERSESEALNAKNVSLWKQVKTDFSNFEEESNRELQNWVTKNSALENTIKEMRGNCTLAHKEALIRLSLKLHGKNWKI